MKLRKVAMTEVLELHVFRIELLMQRVSGKINQVKIKVYNGNIHLCEGGRGAIIVVDCQFFTGSWGCNFVDLEI